MISSWNESSQVFSPRYSVEFETPQKSGLTMTSAKVRDGTRTYQFKAGSDMDFNLSYSSWDSYLKREAHHRTDKATYQFIDFQDKDVKHAYYYENNT
jgi:hypothetical protein